MSVKFAITREDARLELKLIQHVGAENALLVASGGCSLFDLKHDLPSLGITAFDINPDQISHCKQKIQAITSASQLDLNVGPGSELGLNQCGDFEKLFNIFRIAFNELIADSNEVERFFLEDYSEFERKEIVKRWRNNPYWNAVFQSAFNDELLEAMFTKQATQHADPNAYPPYFSQVINNGLLAKDAHSNRWLHHILLGYYLVVYPPRFLNATRLNEIEFVTGDLSAVGNLRRFKMVSLSNIFDWSDDELVENWAKLLQELEPGALVLIRQLNNKRKLESFFQKYFTLQKELANWCVAADRSLFYNRFLVLERK